MRAADPDASSLTYRYWTVQGIPDMDGRCYRGPRSGSTNFSNVNVLSEFDDGSASWSKVWEIDWTKLPAASYGSNGTSVIDNTLFDISNATNSSPSMNVGTSGLTVTPGSASDYGTTRTLPVIHVPCIRLHNAFSAAVGVRLWTHVLASNHAAGFDDLLTGFDQVNTTFSFPIARGINAASNQGFSTWVDVASSNVSGFLNNTVTISNTVNNVVVSELFFTAGFNYRTYYGTWGNDWPGEQELTLLQNYQNGSLAINANFARTTFGPFFGAQRAGSGTALVARFGHSKMEYMF